MSDNPEPMVGRAPYERELEATRREDDPARPWRQAGRSWDLQARRLDTYYRTQGTVSDRIKRAMPSGHPDVARLTNRAAAARKAARRLDRLTATGWVVLHDRRALGTEEIVDHVAIGPDGLSIIQSIAPYGPAPAGVPVAENVHLERIRLHQLVPRIVEAMGTQLAEGWMAPVHGIVAVDGATQFVNETPQVVRDRHVVTEIEGHPRSFSRMQVTDLAMSLENIFPFAPTGDAPR